MPTYLLIEMIYVFSFFFCCASISFGLLNLLSLVCDILEEEFTTVVVVAVFTILLICTLINYILYLPALYFWLFIASGVGFSVITFKLTIYESHQSKTTYLCNSHYSLSGQNDYDDKDSKEYTYPGKLW